MTAPKGNWLGRNAWVLLAIVGAVTAISGIYLLFAGIDGRDFSLRTDTTWEALSEIQPTVAGYIAEENRYLGIAWFAAGILGAAIAVHPFRRGERWAWAFLWVFPTVFTTFIILNARTGSQVWPFYVAYLIVGVPALLASAPQRSGASPLSDPSKIG